MNTYTLDQNEYLLLQVTLESPFAWGIRPELADEKAGQEAMEAALRTLQEKNYLSVGDDLAYVARDLWTLMKASAEPGQVLLFTYADHRDEQDLRFFYWGDDILVQDRVLAGDSRELKRFDTALDAALELKARLKLARQPQPSGTAQTVPSPALGAAQQAASQGKDAVSAKLEQAGVDATTAACLAEAYTAPIANAVLTRILPGEEGASTSMILIESADGLWEMHPMSGTEMRIEPVDAETAWQMVAGFCGVELPGSA